MIRNLTYLTAPQGWTRRHRRALRQINLQIHHRTHVERDLHEVAQIKKAVEFFADKANGTGGRFPYHFVIARSGAIAQLVPLEYGAPGAAGYNTRAVQIAWEGDFRSEEPAPGQWISGVWLAAQLDKLGCTEIAGHTQLPKASRDPGKVCPGPLLSIEDLREDVASALVLEAKEAGLLWTGIC